MYILIFMELKKLIFMNHNSLFRLFQINFNAINVKNDVKSFML